MKKRIHILVMRAHTWTVDCRSSFVSLNAVLLAGSDVVRIDIAGSSDHNVGGVVQDSSGDQFGTDRVADSAASHGGEFSGDNKHDQLTNLEELDVNNCRGPNSRWDKL